MIAARALLLLALQGVADTRPPADWTLLADLPWKVPPRIDPDVADFVDDEVQAGRCSPPASGAASATGADTITVNLAVHTRTNGTLRAVVPRAIGCPTVEQFAAGLVYSMARGNLRRTGDGWYHTQLVFPLAQ